MKPIVLGTLDAARRLVNRIPMSSERRRPLQQKIKYCRIKYLASEAVRRASNTAEWKSSEVLGPESPIYVMWWTGLDTMPEIVRICYDNLVEHSGQNTVKLITKDSIYNIFPSIRKEIEHVLNLYNEGKISIQHFSDIVRTLILYKIGGIWIDATVFVSPDWKDYLYGCQFYSGRRTKEFSNSGKSVTCGQWTSYFIASVKGNPLMKLIYDGLYECLEKEGCIEEYYTMDNLFAIGMRESESIRHLINDVPEIAQNLFKLELMMNESYSEVAFNGMIESAPFYKMNHRLVYIEADAEGKPTLFGHLKTRFKTYSRY